MYETLFFLHYVKKCMYVHMFKFIKESFKTDEIPAMLAAPRVRCYRNSCLVPVSCARNAFVIFISLDKEWT